MIKIEIPEPDYIVTFNTYKEIPRGLGGVYVFYDEEDTPLYTGQASCLRIRIHNHFRGQSTNNTQRYSWAFHKCLVYVEPNQESKNVYECYFINFLKTFLNRNSNPNQFKGNKLVSNDADPNNLFPSFCQYILDTKKQCAKRPHLNGFCSLHGGNGISRQSVIDKAIEDYEKMVYEYYNKEEKEV